MKYSFKFSRIYKDHPRVDFDFIDSLYTFVKRESKSRNRGIRSREISEGLGCHKDKVDRYLRNYLIKYKYVKVSRSGFSRSFLSVESFKGKMKSFFTREEIEEKTREFFRKIVESVKGTPFSLSEKQKDDLNKIEKSIDSERSDYLAYCRLADFLWKQGIKDIPKLSIKSTANRYE